MFCKYIAVRVKINVFLHLACSLFLCTERLVKTVLHAFTFIIHTGKRITPSPGVICLVFTTAP